MTASTVIFITKGERKMMIATGIIRLNKEELIMSVSIPQETINFVPQE